MIQLGIFVAGFASGWVVRSTVDSSRGVAVGLISAAYGAVDRVKRYAAIEKEHLEDLWAEGKAQFERKRDLAAARARANAGVKPGPASVRPERDRTVAEVRVAVPGKGRAA
jgi:hypothetical protein